MGRRTGEVKPPGTLVLFYPLAAACRAQPGLESPADVAVPVPQTLVLRPITLLLRQRRNKPFQFDSGERKSKAGVEFASVSGRL